MLLLDFRGFLSCSVISQEKIIHFLVSFEGACFHQRNILAVEICRLAVYLPVPSAICFLNKFVQDNCAKCIYLDNYRYYICLSLAIIYCSIFLFIRYCFSEWKSKGWVVNNVSLESSMRSVKYPTCMKAYSPVFAAQMWPVHLWSIHSCLWYWLHWRYVVILEFQMCSSVRPVLVPTQRWLHHII